MKQLAMLWICVLGLFSSTLMAAMNDDPVLASVRFEQLEQRQSDTESALVWNAKAWIGKDLNKLYLKTEGDSVNGSTEQMEYQLLYSRGVAPYWDMQFGIRTDLTPSLSRQYLAFGFMGLAPYFFETDVGLFYGLDTGQSSLRLDSEYELMFTQRLVLLPQLEMNLYSQDDAATRIGAGLSDLSLGLRLAYGIRREFAPYLGINWWQKFGQTADYAVADGKASSGTELVAGFRFWF